MSSTEHTQAPESGDHRENDDRQETGQSQGESDHSIAAEAARRQARQDPLQG